MPPPTPRLTRPAIAPVRSGIGGASASPGEVNDCCRHGRHRGRCRTRRPGRQRVRHCRIRLRIHRRNLHRAHCRVRCRNPRQIPLRGQPMARRKVRRDYFRNRSRWSCRRHPSRCHLNPLRCPNYPRWWSHLRHSNRPRYWRHPRWTRHPRRTRWSRRPIPRYRSRQCLNLLPRWTVRVPGLRLRLSPRCRQCWMCRPCWRWRRVRSRSFPRHRRRSLARTRWPRRERRLPDRKPDRCR
jgi:hypothetical protein